MRRRCLLVLAVASLLVGCGLADEGWPEEVRDNFLGACLDGSGGEEDYCRCVLEELEASLTVEEFEELEGDLAEEGDLPPVVEVIVEDCIDQHLT